MRRITNEDDDLKIAVVVGSIRKDSINRILARAVIKLAPENLDCELVRIDDLRVYNRDLDQTPPEPVSRLKGGIAAANGVLFVTPEHNRSLPTALKNTLDWASRPYGKKSVSREAGGHHRQSEACPR
jgi:chromate reductase, NAD(P)H dehydrogenase (quinone)